MRIAIVADWLTTFGGAEHVLANMTAMWPDAPLFTTVAKRGRLGPLDHSEIRSCPSLQWLYDRIGAHQMLLPLMPRAIEGMDFTGFDVVVSSSHAVAKAVIVPPGCAHVCYCHTPMRYAWEMEEQYLRDYRVPSWAYGRVRRILKQLRRWDLSTAKRVDAFIANSSAVAERIARIYGRESCVLPPPVADTLFAHPLPTAPGAHPYYLAIGRLVPYKRLDLLIESANALGFPLWIAGQGQEEERLRAMAGPTVRFLGFVPDADLPALYANATALLFPQFEDAGLVLLEAMACGTPVIAYREGGARDAVEDGVTGILLQEQTVASMQSALARFAAVQWDRQRIRDAASRFSQEHFRTGLSRIVQDAAAATQHRLTTPE